MIITKEIATTNQKGADVKRVEEAQQENPPPYSPNELSASVPCSSAVAAPSNSIQRPTNCTNFVAVQRWNGSIKESYFIDTTLLIPEELLGPPGGGELTDHGLRKNMYLRTYNGSVSANVWLAGDADYDQSSRAEKRTDSMQTKSRALLEAGSYNGSVSVNVRADCLKQPFSLTCWSKNGEISVRIPSSFVGPVTITVYNGSVVFSKYVSERVNTFSRVKQTHKYFIGDPVTSGFGRGEWSGPSLDLSSLNGSVKVSFDDLDEPPLGLKIDKFFSKLFNSSSSK